MLSVVAAAPSSPTVIVESGGGSPWWWFPILVTVLLGLAALAGSYAATWRFKKLDVNRESAFRTIDLVDDAERIASGQDGGNVAVDCARLLRRAGVRAEPLDDRDLADRLRSAVNFADEIAELRGAPRAATLYPLSRAIASVRFALVPHLSAPRLLRSRKAEPPCFPRSKELSEIQARTSDDVESFRYEIASWVRSEESRRATTDGVG